MKFLFSSKDVEEYYSLEPCSIFDAKRPNFSYVVGTKMQANRYSPAVPIMRYLYHIKALLRVGQVPHLLKQLTGRENKKVPGCPWAAVERKPLDPDIMGSVPAGYKSHFFSFI